MTVYSTYSLMRLWKKISVRVQHFDADYCNSYVLSSVFMSACLYIALAMQDSSVVFRIVVFIPNYGRRGYALVTIYSFD
jgi:hypothetical protein